MKNVVTILALAYSALVVSGTALGRPDEKVPKPRIVPQRRIGQIFIVGNERTRQNVILDAIRLSPGEVLRDADLRQAEQKLAKLGIFRNDPVKRIRPTISVIQPDDESEYKDLLVIVEETSTCSFRFMGGLTSRGEVVASFVWEERNFDTGNWPISLDHLLSGNAFRGAAEVLRVEIVQVAVFPVPRLRFLQTGNILFPFGR